MRLGKYVVPVDNRPIVTYEEGGESCTKMNSLFLNLHLIF